MSCFPPALAPSSSGAPLLLTTALPRTRAAELCHKITACAWVTKPFDIADFFSAVRACLMQGGKRAQA